MSNQTRTTQSEAETEAVARELASRLRPGDVVLLSGNLGAGKTTFVRGLAAGLGLDPDQVSSPTFTLLHEYRGARSTLYHADLYRLDAPATNDLGLEELVDGILAVEWPDRLTHIPAHALRVTLDLVDESTRTIRIDQRLET